MILIVYFAFLSPFAYVLEVFLSYKYLILLAGMISSFILTYLFLVKCFKLKWKVNKDSPIAPFIIKLFDYLLVCLIVLQLLGSFEDTKSVSFMRGVALVLFSPMPFLLPIFYDGK